MKDRKNRLAAFAALAGAAFLLPGTAFAADPVPARELPPELRQLVQAIVSQPRVSPGVVFGSPVGFGAATGDVFIGINGSTSENQNDFIGDLDVDGSMAVGFGLGNPVEAVALEVAFNVISLTHAFGDSGAIALKLHKRVGQRGSIAIGTENTLAWGEAKDVVDATTDTQFISYSHYFQLNPGNAANPGGLMLTVGFGQGRLGQLDDPEDAAPFISAGYNITRQVSVIADYAGEAANVGVSVVPFRTIPVSVIVGATDVTEERGDTEFALGVGYSSRF